MRRSCLNNGRSTTRQRAAINLAEAGGTEKEIAAVCGWDTLAMVQT